MPLSFVPLNPFVKTVIGHPNLLSMPYNTLIYATRDDGGWRCHSSPSPHSQFFNMMSTCHTKTHSICDIILNIMPCHTKSTYFCPLNQTSSSGLSCGHHNHLTMPCSSQDIPLVLASATRGSGETII